MMQWQAYLKGFSATVLLNDLCYAVCAQLSLPRSFNQLSPLSLGDVVVGSDAANEIGLEGCRHIVMAWTQGTVSLQSLDLSRVHHVMNHSIVILYFPYSVIVRFCGITHQKT